MLPAGFVLVVAVCLALAAGVGWWRLDREAAVTAGVQADLLAALDAAPGAPAVAPAPPAAPVLDLRAGGAEPSYPSPEGARAVPHGAPLATIEVPRWGSGWRWAVLEGVDEDVLADGPGHYPGTPLPGQPGNVGIAGHRAGHGSPFLEFEDLRPGDEVVLGQGGRTWTYRLTTRPRIVDVDDVWVLDPQPGHVLTLTTCWPKYGSSRRMFVRGELVTGSD